MRSEVNPKPRYVDLYRVEAGKLVHSSGSRKIQVTTILNFEIMINNVEIVAFHKYR